MNRKFFPIILLLSSAVFSLCAEVVEVEPYTDYHVSTESSRPVEIRSGSSSGELLCVLGGDKKEAFFHTASASKVDVSGKAELIVAVGYLCGLPKQTFSAPGENIALKKPYSFAVKPNYPLCKNDGDALELTDGVRVTQRNDQMFWTQKNVVGWMSPNKIVSIIIDLGKMEPIAGVGYGTAAGISGVNWPNHAFVLVSDDGKTWRLAGDLVQLGCEFGISPVYGSYHVRDFASTRLNVRGRYIQLAIVPSSSGLMTFLDEIEVWRGKDFLLKEPAVGAIVTDQNELIRPASRFQRMQDRLRADADMLLQNVKSSNVRRKAELSAQMESAYQQASRIGIDHRIKKAVFPLGKAHETLLAANAPLLAELGFKELTLWKSDRWENTSITALPEFKNHPPVFGIEMMQNEVRSECVNLTNPTDKPLTLNVKMEGLAVPVVLYEVMVTDSTANTPASSVLVPLDGGSVTVPPGCTRQIWISCEKPTEKSGTYRGRLTISGKGIGKSLPFTLKLYDLGFPKENTLLFGGWDYMIGKCDYHGNAKMADRKMAFMRKYGINTAWAHAGVLPTGAKYDAEGKLRNADGLNYQIFDEWIKRWNGARAYCIFLNTLQNRFNEKIGTPRFNRMVGEYFNAVAARCEKMGVDRSRLVFELVDEPSSKKPIEENILPYLRAMKNANVGVKIFENPLLIDQVMAEAPELFRESDIICFDLLASYYHLKNITDARLAVMEKVAENGKTIWLYECAGPALSLDPASYYRGLSWHAIKYGAKGIMFWAMGCTGESGSSWNPYDAKYAAYSPYFIDDESVNTTKQMEGIREGMGDYEYARLLKSKVAALEKAGNAERAAEGKKLLNDAVNEVITPYHNGIFLWNRKQREQDRMERNRLAILHWLVKNS